MSPKEQGKKPLLTAVHEGKWVAITPDNKKGVAFADRLDELMKRVKGMDVVYTRGLKSGAVYAF